jgi:hypothetical protein
MVSRKGANPMHREVCSLPGASAMSRWRGGVIAVCCLGLLSLMPSRGAAQTGQPGTVPNPNKHQEGALLALGQNYPNPFSPATRIPFTVGNPPTCSDAGRRYRVSLKVYNLLAQLIAVPVMAEGMSATPIGQPVQSLELACGQYTAFWDGTGFASNRAVASGLYLYRLEVNGKPVAARKMLIQR